MHIYLKNFSIKGNNNSKKEQIQEERNKPKSENKSPQGNISLSTKFNK